MDTENRPTPGSCTRRRSVDGSADKRYRSSAPGADNTEQNPEAKSPGPHSGFDSPRGLTRIDCPRIDRHRLDDYRVDGTVPSSRPHFGDLIDAIASRYGL